MKTLDEIKFFLHLGYFPNYPQTVTLDYAGITPSRYSDTAPKDLIKQAGEIFQSTIANQFKTNQRHIVPISGGLDSRAILAALLECTSATNIETYTFGTPGTYDYDIGCAVAIHAGTQHTAIPLDSFDWNEAEFVTAAQRFNHQTFLCHHAPISVLKQFEGGITWSGYIGDAVTGGHLTPKPSQTLTQARAQYLKKRREVRSMAMLPPDEINKLSANIGCVEQGALSYDERVLFAEVGSITAPHVLMRGHNYKTPFISSPIFDFYMSLPPRQRLGQHLFKSSMQERYPMLFGLPCKNAYGLTLNAPRSHQFIRRTRNKIWNIGRSNFKNIDWPSLPMTNFFDIDKLILKNSNLKDFSNNKIKQLKSRDMLPWIDIDAIWNRHIARKANHGDAIKILISLEVNLQGLEAKKP